MSETMNQKIARQVLLIKEDLLEIEKEKRGKRFLALHLPGLLCGAWFILSLLGVGVLEDALVLFLFFASVYTVLWLLSKFIEAVQPGWITMGLFALGVLFGPMLPYIGSLFAMILFGAYCFVWSTFTGDWDIEQYVHTFRFRATLVLVYAASLTLLFFAVRLCFLS